MQALTLKPLPTRLNPGCLTRPYHLQNRLHTCHSNTPNAQMLEAIAPGTQIDSTARDQVALALQKHPELIAMLRGRTDPTSFDHQLSGIEWTEISDGRINYVYELRGCEGALLVKHAAPHVKSVGPAFPLSQVIPWVSATSVETTVDLTLKGEWWPCGRPCKCHHTLSAVQCTVTSVARL